MPLFRREDPERDQKAVQAFMEKHVNKVVPPQYVQWESPSNVGAGRSSYQEYYDPVHEENKLPAHERSVARYNNPADVETWRNPVGWAHAWTPNPHESRAPWQGDTFNPKQYRYTIEDVRGSTHRFGHEPQFQWRPGEGPPPGYRS